MARTFNAVILLLISLLSCSSVAKNGCRQCTGFKTISFGVYTSQSAAFAYFRASLGNCATGDDYQLIRVETVDCIRHCDNAAVEGHHTFCGRYSDYSCKHWTFILKAWRYCGNGPSVNFSVDNNCIGSKCALSESLSLVCSRSVECKGTCDCGLCGC